MTTAIHQAHLSYCQAAVVLVVRYRCYANPLTGRSDKHRYFPYGYEEIAACLGLSRLRYFGNGMTGYSRHLLVPRKNRKGAFLPLF